MLRVTQAGVSREDAYQAVQRSAMKVWQGNGDLQALLADDPQVAKHLTRKQLAACFDLGYHLKNVDVLFRRVFGKNPVKSTTGRKSVHGKSRSRER